MWRRRRSQRDRREEMRAHVQLEADQLEVDGLSPEAARAAARARFGHGAHRDAAERWLGPGWVAILVRDLRYAARRLRQSPIATATILASLILGIGANTAIFSLADQVLLRALPVRAPHELVQLHWDGNFIGGGRGFGSLLPHPLYLELREQQEVFQAIAARSPGAVNAVNGERSERYRVELVTGSYFGMLGVQPYLGRVFTDDDDRVPDGHPVVILSHATWRARFGADPGVVGRELRINARPMTIVGVAPPGFHGTDWSVTPDIWLPMMMNDLVHTWGDLDGRRQRFQHVYARLNPGVTAAQAESVLRPWFERYIRADMERAGWPGQVDEAALESYLDSSLLLHPGGQGQAAQERRLRQPLLIVTAGIGLVLLLACLNVANLSIAKAVAQRRETSVRIALGASRRHLMAERLAEAALLATVGGAIGMLLAPFAGRWVLSYLAPGGGAGMALSAGLDGRALAIALGVALFATVASGVGPAWFASSSPPAGALRAGGRSASGGIGLRRGLVVAQVALALVLLVGAGLFGETLRLLKLEGPGYRTQQLVSFRLDPSSDGYEAVPAKQVLLQILQEIRALPDVESAGMSLWPMLQGGGWGNPMIVQGSERVSTDSALPMNSVSPGFFATLGVPVVAGRDFDSRDAHDDGRWELRSVIVSESFVRRYLPDEDPLGARLAFGGDDSVVPNLEVIGVVRGYREHALRDDRPQVFFSIREAPTPTATFYVRGRSATEALVPGVLGVVDRIDPMLGVNALRTVDDQIDVLLAFERMLAALGRAFAIFATLLATIGIYGVLSFWAQSRTKEIGIRIALGAPQGSTAGRVVAEALRLAAFGAAYALPAAWMLGRWVEGSLYGVSVVNPAVAAAAAGVLLLVCIVASAAPAWRAATVNPLEALRTD